MILSQNLCHVYIKKLSQVIASFCYFLLFYSFHVQSLHMFIIIKFFNRKRALSSETNFIESMAFWISFYKYHLHISLLSMLWTWTGTYKSQYIEQRSWFVYDWVKQKVFWKTFTWHGICIPMIPYVCMCT